MSLETTLDGAGVLRGDLTPECAAMVRAVLDALSAPAGGGDLRTRPERYHDALEEAMRRLLASNLLPKRAGQPVKALVARVVRGPVRPGRRLGPAGARGSPSTGPGGPRSGPPRRWPPGTAAPGWRATRPARIACDAMIIPVVTGDLDPARSRT